MYIVEINSLFDKILGNDFLEKNKCVIDFGQNTLLANNEIIKALVPSNT